MKSKVDVLIGCRQGGPQPPCLFNYYFDYVLRVAAFEIDNAFPDERGIEYGYNIPHTCEREQRNCGGGRLHGRDLISWMLYADDLALLCKTVTEAKKLLNILTDTCKRFGLSISFKKTKTQVFNHEELAKSHHSSQLMIK